MFCKNDKVLEDLILSLKDEFKLTEKGDLETFLSILFKKLNYNKLELTQPYLIQRIIDALGMQAESKMHDASANVTLNRDENRKKRAQT